MTVDFLREVSYHSLLNNNFVVKCYGISQDPRTKNYTMIMQYIPEGDLRKYLDNNYKKLTFMSKLDQLIDITAGLKSIHEKGLFHKDFHSGNILNEVVFNIGKYRSYITDLGLSRPANKDDDGTEVFGRLPYVSPEVLNKKRYTLVADIYSWGIITTELFSGLPPYHDIAHDVNLAIKICQGLRPNLNDIKIPQLLKDLIEKCWDADASNRPTAAQLHDKLNEWY
jgi:serine/threonine protein kinase